MSQLPNKIVAVLNKSIETGKVMNALAHMSIGFGAALGEETLELVDYQDADQNTHPNISKMPFIVLKTNSNKIRRLRLDAIEKNIRFVDFTDPMTVGTWEEQIERSSKTKEEDLTYYGIVLFGDYDVVSEMTRKYSLWQ